MSISRLVTWITFLAVFAMATQVSLDTDTWWHLRAGEWMVEHRAILQTDLFSYTRQGEAWQYPGWIVQIPMALIYRTFGPGGLNLWVAGMVTLSFAFIWRVMEGGVFLKAFITVLGAAVTGVYWSARPYMVTFVLAAVFLWVLEDFRAGRKERLWWLPMLMILWANAHGGFAVGFILCGIYGLEAGINWLLNTLRIARQEEMIENKMTPFEAQIQKEHANPLPIANLSATLKTGFHSSISKWLLLGFFLLIAVCLNPSGPVMLMYPFQTVTIESLQDYIQEWQSPNFHDAQMQPFAWMLLLTIGAVGASPKKISIVDFLLVAGFAYLGLLAARNVALFGLASTVVLSRHAGALLEATGSKLGIKPFNATGRVRSPVHSWVNRSLVGLVILAVAAKTMLILPEAENEKTLSRYLPMQAVTFLAENQPQGRLFNSYNWGAYLLWALPEYPVFVDGRTDLYNDEIISQWFQIVRAETGWQDSLERWEVRVILLERGSPVLSHLQGEGWQLMYEDDMAVVYAK